MKNISAIIIDNEKNLCEALASLLKIHCPEVDLYGMAFSAREGRHLLKEVNVDLIFLDISMPEEDGFAFLSSIKKEDYGIIFVTAYEEYALRALRASAIDYLLKPVIPDELCEAVVKAAHHIEMRKSKPKIQSVYRESLENLQNHIHSENRHIGKITIPEQFGFRVVNVADLMYLVADSNYTTLYMKNSERIVATKPLGEFENMLNDLVFFRIHKSSIINLNFLKSYSSYQGNYAEMNDGEKLAISRRKMNEFRDIIKNMTNTIT